MRALDHIQREPTTCVIVMKEEERPNVQPGRSTLFRAHLNSLIRVAKPFAPWSVARTVIYSRCFSGHPYLLGVSRHGKEVARLVSEAFLFFLGGGGISEIAHHQEYANSSVSTSCFPLDVCREPAPPTHENRLQLAHGIHHVACLQEPRAGDRPNNHTNYDETPRMRRLENRFFDLGMALNAELIDLVELS